MSGISTTAPQATGDPTSTCQDTHATSWVSLPDTKRTGQSCIVSISLALLADRREKGQWWPLWAHASFITSGCLLYRCHSPGAFPALCLCYIQSSPLPQTLKVIAGDKQKCRWVSELIWGNHHYIPAMLIYHMGIMQILHILGPG